MNIVKQSQGIMYEHGVTCTALEYPLNDPDINIAVIMLEGRYPEKGCATNEISKELALVAIGSGKVVINNIETSVSDGDLVSIDPGEKFFWEGKMILFMPCVPAWTPEQYKLTE